MKVYGVGKDVQEILFSISADYAGLHKHIFNQNGDIRSSIYIFRNADDIRCLDGSKTPLKSGDVLFVLPAISGG